MGQTNSFENKTKNELLIIDGFIEEYIFYILENKSIVSNPSHYTFTQPNTNDKIITNIHGLIMHLIPPKYKTKTDDGKILLTHERGDLRPSVEASQFFPKIEDDHHVANGGVTLHTFYHNGIKCGFGELCMICDIKQFECDEDIDMMMNQLGFTNCYAIGQTCYDLNARIRNAVRKKMSDAENNMEHVEFCTMTNLQRLKMVLICSEKEMDEVRDAGNDENLLFACAIKRIQG